MQAIALLISASALPAFAQSVTLVTTFDYPNAVQTFPSAISDTGDITGSYVDTTGATLGFIRRSDGGFSPPLIDPHTKDGFTEASGINNSHFLVGLSSDGRSHYIRGFLYAHGNFVTYNVPGALSTGLYGVNNAGDLAGYYIQSRTLHGFIDIGGNVTDIHIPGSRSVVAVQLNGSDAVAGTYWLGVVAHGYYRDAAGGLRYPIDPAGSTYTYLSGINDENWITGAYTDTAGIEHGLLYQPATSTFVTYDYPGTTDTFLGNINRHGEIIGSYTDSSGNS
ncbi:MAG TPA: hypothetical protein VHW03_06095, partial [Chthoniobacterales bacterium]|nr:hypothetical protein [Chthoniobacterales bacterium]